jgi:hypothetical protein
LKRNLFLKKIDFLSGIPAPPTPYVRHSTDCTCCYFGHLRFYIKDLKDLEDLQDLQDQEDLEDTEDLKDLDDLEDLKDTEDLENQ